MSSDVKNQKKSEQYERNIYLIKIELLEAGNSNALYETKLLHTTEIETDLRQIKEFPTFEEFYKYSNTTMLHNEIERQIFNKGHSAVWQVNKYIITSGKKEKIITVMLDIDYDIIDWTIYPEYETYCEEPYQKELFLLNNKTAPNLEKMFDCGEKCEYEETDCSLLFGDLFEEEKDEEIYYHIYLGKYVAQGFGEFISTEGINNCNFVIDDVIPLSRLNMMRKASQSSNRIMKAASMMLKSDPFKILWWKINYYNTKYHFPDQTDGHMARTIRCTVDYAIRRNKFHPQR